MDETIRERLLADPVGKDAPKCFSCGMCVAGCPVAYHSAEYSPVGNLSDAYHYDYLNPLIWWCATCYACQDRCPHDVRMVEIVFLMQRLYVERHGRPDFIDALVSQVERSGYMASIDDRLNAKRVKMGLPALGTDLARVLAPILAALNGDPDSAEEEGAP